MRTLLLSLVVTSLVSYVLLTFAISSDAVIDPNTAAGIWSFDKGDAKDSSKKGLNGNIVGGVKSVKGVVGKALQFDGKKGGIKIPDSADINTGGPYTDRTIVAFFNCDDVDIDSRKQTIYEEGGRTRGLVLYVFDGEVYVGGWNRAEYNWNGAWPSAPVKSNKWYHVGLVIRNAKGKVEKDKFEMWLNGDLIAKESGGQLHAHGDDIGIGHVNQNTVFHDEDGSGSDIHWFGGMIDEVAVYNSAFDEADFRQLAKPVRSVEPEAKFAITWGAIKAQWVVR
ncbi:MAG: LamG-like jellyroll fold domain-containing protein [Candidatus Poribacteria bacterium]